MKPFVLCAALVLTSFSTTAFAADKPSLDATAEAKPAKRKKAEKVAPATEAAATKTPDAAPVPLETLPPPPPAPAPAPPPAPANPDRVEAAPATTGSTRIEAVAGRTQTWGFAVGVRAGHRMANNVYVGGTAMVQTGLAGGFITYPAGELGYEAKLGDARFMPYLGLGPMFVIPTTSSGKVEVTPLLYPGFTFRIESDKTPLTAGADVRFLYLTETDLAVFALNVTAGVRF